MNDVDENRDFEALKDEKRQFPNNLAMSTGCPRNPCGMRLLVIDLRGPMTLHTWICEKCGVRKDELVPTLESV